MVISFIRYIERLSIDVHLSLFIMFQINYFINVVKLYPRIDKVKSYKKILQLIKL